MERTTEESAAVAITGRGMVSSLGEDVVTACAAARAGLALPAPLNLKMRSPEDGKAEDVLGHPAGELTRGFEGFARLVRLTALGLRDLLRQAPDGPWQSTQVGAYLALPDPYRVHTGLDLIADASLRETRAKEAREAIEAPDPDMPRGLLQTAADLARWPVNPQLRFWTTSGHAGVAEALHRAMDDLHRGQVGAAVVGGVDSLVEEETVMWLHNTGRLKRTGIPVGLLPGEAGAFVLLETARAARTRGAHPHGVVQAVALEDESATLLSGAPAHGAALAKALSSVADTGKLDNPADAWVLSDQNGETYRATEWGHALVRLAALPLFATPVVAYPAASFGDTGAASGAISLCVALHAFRRGAAPTPAALVASSSDGERRAAILVRATEPEPRSTTA